MRKLISLALTLAMVLSIMIIPAMATSSIDTWDGTIATSFAGGTGTESDPYLISTAEQLAYIAQIVNSDSSVNYKYAKTYGKFYKLTADLDLSNKEWTPIGLYSSVGNSYCFMGTFNGNGHTIKNMSITKTNNPYIGLFGYVGSQGKITNFNITSSNINVTCDDTKYENYVIGLAVGSLNNASNINAIGNINTTTNTGRRIIAGGAFGACRTFVTDCTSNVQLSVNFKPIIENNAYTVRNIDIGGLIGESGCLKNCYSAGSVTVNAIDGRLNVGGITGFEDGGSTRNCESTTKINIKNEIKIGIQSVRVGGVAGKVNGDPVRNSKYTGEITVDAPEGYIGGLIGVFNGNEGTYSYDSTDKSELNSVIECCAKATITTQSSSSKDGIVEVGGLIGECYSAKVTNCYSDGSINSNYSSTGVVSAGGLIGYLYNYVPSLGTKVDKCYSTSSVNASASSSVDGVYQSPFVAYSTSDDDSQTNVQISNCVSTGNICTEQYNTTINSCDTNSSSMNSQSALQQKGFDFTNTWVMGSSGKAELKNCGATITSVPSDNSTAPTIDKVLMAEWAKPEVLKAYDKKLINLSILGKDYTQVITRYQFCDVVVKMIEAYTGSTLTEAPAGTFTDCAESCVLKAYNAGIVNGVGNNQFAPDTSLDRQTLATMLSRAIKYMYSKTGKTPTFTSTISTFPDKGSVASWAYEGMDMLTGMKVMAGSTNSYGQTVLAPNESCAIQQCLVLAYRTLVLG